MSFFCLQLLISIGVWMDNLILLHELQVFMIRFDENVQEEPTGQMDMPQGKKEK